MMVEGYKKHPAHPYVYIKEIPFLEVYEDKFVVYDYCNTGMVSLIKLTFSGDMDKFYHDDYFTVFNPDLAGILTFSYSEITKFNSFIGEKIIDSRGKSKDGIYRV